MLIPGEHNFCALALTQQFHARDFYFEFIFQVVRLNDVNGYGWERRAFSVILYYISHFGYVICCIQ